MVRFAEVQEGSVVQLGRFNKGREPFSYTVGLVTAKTTNKAGKIVTHQITVRIARDKSIVVHLHNIKDILH